MKSNCCLRHWRLYWWLCWHCNRRPRELNRRHLTEIRIFVAPPAFGESPLHFDCYYSFSMMIGALTSTVIDDVYRWTMIQLATPLYCTNCLPTPTNCLKTIFHRRSSPRLCCCLSVSPARKRGKTRKRINETRYFTRHAPHGTGEKRRRACVTFHHNQTNNRRLNI